MPKGSPFTQLCQQAARLAAPVAADLHAHTTASDGDATPGQLVLAAARANLRAIAVTDHDTTAGVGPAQDAAAGLEPGRRRPEVIPGVEVSAAFRGREVHVLGLFIRPDDQKLTAALNDIGESRRERFRAYLHAIPELAPAVDLGLAAAMEAATASPGRRHVALLTVRAGLAKNYHEGFYRFVHRVKDNVPPKRLIPVADAIRLICAAGGVSSLAHPPDRFGDDEFAVLRGLGLTAIEARFPSRSAGRGERLRELASRHGLAVTAGSDSHNPTPPGRVPGCCGVTADELADLRKLAGV